MTGTTSTRRVTRSSYKNSNNSNSTVGGDEYGDTKKVKNGGINKATYNEGEIDYSYEAQEEFDEPPIFVSIFTYVSYTLLIMLAYLKDILVKYGIISFGSSRDRSKMEVSIANVKILLKN